MHHPEADVPRSQGQAFLDAILYRSGIRSERALARAAQMDASTFQAWKHRGARPSPDAMARLAPIAHLSLSQLYDLYARPEATETPDAAVTALRDLTPVLAALAAAVEKMAAQDARLDEMEATLRALVVPTIATGATPRAPRRTKG